MPRRSVERDAVLSSAQSLTRVVPGEKPVGASFRALAAHSKVGIGKAQGTLRDMARAGELVRVGTGSVPGASRPVVLYAARPPASEAPAPAPADLVGLLRNWVSRPDPLMTTEIWRRQ